ncbi:50S ribosomal protein L9 [Kordiimonas sediminis]|uniref:Large ribosomal subunit protein bL9 n=1 Tax=Kordiimonas sediminis TaxID=1735581 RepID=A0A919AVF2_9PROT|nr:50S ribosomal protein L9 [Kordiimonas sediminis]GHF27553.1 50S ribosomal protein L9 [Kordiimonas sediminis]
MEVILLERVEKLGQMGDTVTVKDGFARNYLLPQNKAMRATVANKAVFEAERARLEAENLERKSEAEAVAAKMDGLKSVLIRSAGESGQLYGSVNSRDIATSVTEAGVAVSRSQIVLDRAIKTLGLHDVIIRLHPEVSATVVINIARSEEEAQTQFETGSIVSSSFDDEDELDVSAEEIFEEEAEVDVEVSEEAEEETAE